MGKKPKFKYLAGAQDLEQAVFIALGAASACWENLSGAGTFESERAKQVGDELLDYIKLSWQKALLEQGQNLQPEVVWNANTFEQVKAELRGEDQYAGQPVKDNPQA